LVEAIRRAYGSPAGYGGLDDFHVGSVFDFLVAAGFIVPGLVPEQGCIFGLSIPKPRG
jgi:hypothetical protein